MGVRVLRSARRQGLSAGRTRSAVTGARLERTEGDAQVFVGTTADGIEIELVVVPDDRFLGGFVVIHACRHDGGLEVTTRRFPDRIPADVEVTDIDLDTEEFYFRGERLTEQRAQEVAEEILAKIRGRPSLSGPGATSPNLTVRLPVAERTRLDAAAEREGRRVSDVVRQAIDEYLSRTAG